jgi:hypothetical protein
MAKLTLSVDDRVIARAKRYARQSGVSISQLVEAYLASVARPASPNEPDAPVLRALRGTLKNADVDGYRQHLAAKYR